jgi:ABC-type transport system involved in multi-copper enzyme maturation permease subunit
MRLWWVEVRRLFARRFTRLALLLILGVLGLMVFTGAYGSHKPSSADLAAAQQEATQLQAHERARCEAAQGHGAPAGGRPPAPVPSSSAVASPSATGSGGAAKRSPSPRASVTPPPATASPPATAPPPSPAEALPGEFTGVDCASIDYPTAREVLGPVFTFRSEMPGRALAIGVMLALMGYLVGASFVGAEWQHGTMSGLLLWEPRRVTVFLAKLFALLTGLVLIGAVTYAVGFGAHWLVADQRGDAGGLTRGMLESLGLASARGVALALVVAMCGFAIAYAVRLSAAALGAAIAYVIGAEVGLRILSQESQRWLLSENISAWLERGLQYAIVNCDGAGPCTEKVQSITMWQGGAYVAGLALVLAVVAALVFARRDVT